MRGNTTQALLMIVGYGMPVIAAIQNVGCSVTLPLPAQGKKEREQ